MSIAQLEEMHAANEKRSAVFQSMGIYGMAAQTGSIVDAIKLIMNINDMNDIRNPTNYTKYSISK